MKKKFANRSRSALNIKKPKYSKTIKYALTPEQIYQINFNQLDYGIEGYATPHSYFDYNQVM